MFLHQSCALIARLVEQFGSTRRKRQMTAKELATVNPESIGAPDTLDLLAFYPCLQRLGNKSVALPALPMAFHNASLIRICLGGHSKNRRCC